MIYPLVKEMAEIRTGHVRVWVSVACRVLGFSKQAYYKWAKTPLSARESEEVALVAAIRKVHVDDPTFGYRLIFDELVAAGWKVSERRIWRLCSKYGIVSTIGRKYRYNKGTGTPADDDLVKRDFTADDPNVLWLTDITEHHTGQGKLYLCCVKDVYSNRIVGWSISHRMKASLAVDALIDAWNRRGHPQGVIIHSDRGSQFGSRKYIRICEVLKIRRSMGQARTCADNAAMESFFALLQKNVLNQHSYWPTRDMLRLAIIRWIEGTYNRRRRQRRLGKLTPIEYENAMAETYAMAA